MTIAAWNRVYFAAVGSFALWVGLWGYFIPGEVARAIPWAVPPLHARFIGAMYLSGLVLMLGGLLTLRRSDVKVALWMAAIWTGMLMLVSLLHLGEFDFGLPQVWFWFGAYIVYPVAGAWLAHISPSSPALASSPVAPPWVRTYLTAQGVVSTVLALLLLLAPDFMGSVWPWKIPVLLTQIYSGPFLSYGIGSLLLARRERWIDLRVPLVSMLVFAFLVLAASIIHRAVFGEIGPAAMIWFTTFAAITLILAWLSLRAFTDGRRAA